MEYDNGLQQVCCFKYEDQIDELLRVLHKMHPEIPCVSEEEEAELEVEYEPPEGGRTPTTAAQHPRRAGD